MIVLVEDRVVGSVSLTIEEVVSPQYDRHKIVGSNELRLSRASGIYFLFGGCVDWHAFTKGHASARVATHVRMRGMGTVHTPFGDWDGVRA